jgi:hypothetical protein
VSQALAAMSLSCIACSKFTSRTLSYCITRGDRVTVIWEFDKDCQTYIREPGQEDSVATTERM